jgi:hypothetical protein
MFKQSVNIVEFPQLYNILVEVNDLFKFNIYNYQKSEDFIHEIEINNFKCIDSPIIINQKKINLTLVNKIDKNNILLIDEFPIRIEKLIEKINIHLIKKKYNFQSNINIKDYVLNINSRIISNKTKQLKLTEREIDIILFLNENEKSQPVANLQSKVWGYSVDLETHTVETHIYRLRKRINDNFNDKNFIITDKVGYKI